MRCVFNEITFHYEYVIEGISFSLVVKKENPSISPRDFLPPDLHRYFKIILNLFMQFMVFKNGKLKTKCWQFINRYDLLVIMGNIFT